MICKSFILFVLLASYLSAERAVIAGDFDLADIPIDWQEQRETFQIQSISFVNFHHFLNSEYDPSVKIVFMNPPCPLSMLGEITCLREKPVIFLWEPLGIESFYFSLFSRVYTCNDSLVDGKKIFKFYYPYKRDMTTDIPSFHKKKLCVLITRNWTSKRTAVTSFFNKKHREDFDLYGFFAGDFENTPIYKGVVPGYHSGDEKIEVLKNYRFSICFENVHHIPGYISEKIFACFAAGCIPIYLGAPNVDKYIPRGCFIDYRSFKSDEEMYKYIRTMPIDVYESYVNNIRTFLKSEKAQLFSIDNFVKILHRAIL